MRRVVGIHSAKEVLKVRPHAVKKILLAKESQNSLHFFSQWAKEHKVPLELQTLKALTKLSLCQSHQGVLLEVHEKPLWKGSSPETFQQVLILDGIEDPHNLGAILRTAWLMEVKAIFIPERRASKLNSTAMKVAQGGAEHVPVMESSLLKTITDLKAEGFWSYGLHQEASEHLWAPHLHLNGKVLWVIGSEEKGIRKPLLKQCDHLISIPQCQKEASYNVSVATAMALNEARRLNISL